MRRKIYETYAEQKLDQRIGFVIFPIVNLILWAIITFLRSRISSLDLSPETAQLKVALNWLPWIINSLIVMPALIIRMSIGTGYLVSLVGFTVWGAGVGLITVVVTFASVPLIALAGELGFTIFACVLVAGGLWFTWGMFQLLRRWWAL